MMITTKTQSDSLISSMDSAAKTSANSLINKSASELYKFNNKANSTTEEFNNILNSKIPVKKKEVETNKNEVSSRTESSETLDKVKDKVDELNDKLKDLEEDSKADSKDKIEEVLAELLKLLAGLGIDEKKLQKSTKVDSELIKTVGNGQGLADNIDSLMEKIMKLLKDDSLENSLDSNSLKLMNNILNNLSDSLGDSKKEFKNGIQNLISKISDMLDNKQNESNNKLLTLEDMLNKNYSQSNSESSTGDENKDTGASKEDKFLKSLIDDKKDDSLNKINLFASRVGTIQNQGTNAVRGLTINKAAFTEDLVRDVKFMSNNSLKELTVKVNPGNLGEITIKLIQEDGIMKANLKASSKETTALISQNLADIKKQLNEQNIKIADVNIELYQDDTTFFKDQGFQGQLAGEQHRQNNNSQSSIGKVESISSESLEENLAEENNNISFFA